MQKARGIHFFQRDKKGQKEQKEQKGDFKGFKGFKGLKLDVGLKKCRERGEFCAKRKGESAAGTGRFVIFGRGAKKMHRARQMQGIQENALRSLPKANEEGVYRSMTQQLPAICVFFRRI